MTTKAKVAEGLAIARGVFEAFEERAATAKNANERSRAFHTIKKMVGLLMSSKRKKPRGGPKGKRKYLEIDRQVIESEYRYGSIPKAVAAFMKAGLLPVREPKTHIDRINALKREITSEVSSS
jgi:hypothetical protein